MGLEKLIKGFWGEDVATRFLKKSGHKIMERNYRTRFGEIDIIARDEETIVFVEVKTRGQALFGSPEESVGAIKQGNIIAASRHYLSESGLEESLVRFDVLCVETDRKSGGFSVRHIKDAFGV